MGSEQSVNNYNTYFVDASDYDDYSNADPTSYFRNISLRLFAAEPRRMLGEHAKFKELCLENDDPEAHFIEGILQYFIHKEKHTGLFHLCQSATANYENSVYLYGLLRLAKGNYITGKRYLDRLQWKEKLSTSDHFWERIKYSLREIPVPMKRAYYINMVNLQPRTNCHPDNMAVVCKNCYYFKRLEKFVEFATN
ncbi:hypothetical protein Bca4012_026463 [Brassica carinata]|uniref:At2g35280-like TPR domain-containing protein n=1 Tax=Brassica carinata TaxID=52824 RepID=A0A8X8AUH8_BRACI|nr:hypothetical protein Bca52824_023504 [Brassica carinata]